MTFRGKAWAVMLCGDRIHLDVEMCCVELSMLLTKANQALPDELASITASSSPLTQLPISAAQNGSDLRAAETILKNRNLSNLLNSDNVPRAPPNAVTMLPAVGGRYQNVRHQVMAQQTRQFGPNSGLRVGMAQPGAGQMPMYMQIPGTPMHPTRGPVVGYPSRHPADIMRAGGGAFDGAGRQFVNPASSYFMNGPDMRSAMMNGAPFQRPQGGAYPAGPTPMAAFPPGQGQFGMAGFNPGSNPGHGSAVTNVFPGMVVPSESGQAFSPGLAMSIPNSFVSAGTFAVGNTTNSGPVLCSRSAVSVPSPAPVVSAVSTQLLNGSYVPSSTLGHKPSLDAEAAAKTVSSVSGSISSLSMQTLNCQRFNVTLPDVTSISSRQTGSRQLPAPEKDGSIFALETSLVSHVAFVIKAMCHAICTYSIIECELLIYSQMYQIFAPALAFGPFW